MQAGADYKGELRRNETLCALVLGGAPIVRAGIIYMLKRQYAGRAHVFSADWQARDRALAECGERLDLVVLHSDGEASPDACLRLVNGIKGAGALVVVPPTEMRLVTRQDGIVLIPLGSPLQIWRKALQVAAARRAHLPSLVCEDSGTGRLTERQHEVLEMLSMGLSNKTIASRLSLSVGTVKLHVTAVLRALKARNRLELVLSRAAMRTALEHGQLSRSTAVSP
jgi:DNA-binding CsgD family transcriptional regulator